MNLNQLKGTERGGEKANNSTKNIWWKETKAEKSFAYFEFLNTPVLRLLSTSQVWKVKNSWLVSITDRSSLIKLLLTYQGIVIIWPYGLIGHKDNHDYRLLTHLIAVIVCHRPRLIKKYQKTCLELVACKRMICRSVYAYLIATYDII